MFYFAVIILTAINERTSQIRTCRLADWPTDRLADWPTDRLADWRRRDRAGWEFHADERTNVRNRERTEGWMINGSEQRNKRTNKRTNERNNEPTNEQRQQTNEQRMDGRTKILNDRRKNRQTID